MSDQQNPPDEAEPSIQDPGFASVRNYLLYGLSLPERALRSSAGMVGGVLRESAALLVPQAFQSSKTYNIFVQQMLDFMVKDMGGVEHQTDDGQQEQGQVDNYVARKTVGNFIELAGLATLHLSPMTILAVVSDVAYGSQSYLKELSEELKQQGVIDQNTTIDDAADLLSAVGRASGISASAFDTPPLSVEGLKETIEQTQQAVRSIDAAKLLPQAEVERLWNQMHDIARQQDVSAMQVSSAMTMHALDKIGQVGHGALSTVKVAGNMFDRHILDHYKTALTDIGQQGIYASLAQSSRPYIDSVWKNFSTDNPTVTEDVVSGKMIGRAYQGVRKWLGGSQAPPEQ